MSVVTTSAMCITIGTTMAFYPAEQQLPALVTIALVIGIVQLIAGLLKLGFLVRFVSNAVMTGFLSGLGVLIVLSQLGDLTGYDSEFTNKVMQALDLLRQLGQIDIPTTFSALTATARKLLRQDFLQADIGISGVNFGVAESGAICLLTNEGNGRMVTTLPKVHIALMGIERLVPTYRDLALMLELVPPSATGQKLTVYTSLMRGPRRQGEKEGPLERHIVLVDNGRKALRDSALREILYCIRCGACLNACPVFRELGGHDYLGVSGKDTAYPGPVGSVVSPGLLGVSEFGNLARASTLCGACKEACPVDSDLPKLLLRVRAEGAYLSSGQKKGGKTGTTIPLIPPIMRMALKAFAWAAISPRRFHAAQSWAGVPRPSSSG